MRLHLLLLLLAISSFCVKAGTVTDTVKKASVKRQDIFVHHLSFQLEAGTQGPGGDFRYGINKHLSARIGGSFIPFTGNNLVELPGFQSTNSIRVNFYNIHLLADYVPFTGFRSLRLVAGGAYLYKADGGFTVIPTGSYTYNGITVTGTDIGTLNMDVTWKGFAPYAGLGLFRSFPHHAFNVNLDLGTYYLTAPQTHIVGTGLLADNYKLEPQFNQNLKDYRWLPVVQLNFNFRIK